MKNTVIFILLLAINSVSIAADEGTGQGESMTPSNYELFAMCSTYLQADEGTGQGKADEGTGQIKADEGTGQGKSSDPFSSYCKQLMR